MRQVNFYRTESGRCPVEDFLDSLNGKQAQKVAWVLQLVGELDVLPRQYMKKLVNTDDIWEVRVQFAGDIFRLLGFFVHNELIILTNGFAKKTQKTPPRKLPWPNSANASFYPGDKAMSDLQSYIQKRLVRDPEFAEGFAEGYEEFKLGVLLRHAREMAGLSQADIAHRIGTPTSTIIQIESHTENVRLSLLRQYAEALGKNLYITLG